MPSATANTGGFAIQESSFAERRRPVSDAAAQEIRTRPPLGTTTSRSP
jgi:hypothetical protein